MRPEILKFCLEAQSHSGLPINSKYIRLYSALLFFKETIDDATINYALNHFMIRIHKLSKNKNWRSCDDF